MYFINKMGQNGRNIPDSLKEVSENRPR